MRWMAIAQSLRDIERPHVWVSEHPAGDVETRLVQHLGVAGAHIRQSALQAALTGTTQSCGKFDAEISLLDVCVQELLE